jgi:hypothetical protein
MYTIVYDVFCELFGVASDIQLLCCISLVFLIIYIIKN